MEQEPCWGWDGTVMGTLADFTARRMKGNIYSVLRWHRYGLARSGMCFQTGRQEFGVGLCGSTNNAMNTQVSIQAVHGEDDKAVRCIRDVLEVRSRQMVWEGKRIKLVAQWKTRENIRPPHG